VLLGGDTVVLTQVIVTLINILIQMLVALIITQLKNKTKWYIFIYSNPNDNNFFFNNILKLRYLIQFK